MSLVRPRDTSTAHSRRDRPQIQWPRSRNDVPTAQYATCGPADAKSPDRLEESSCGSCHRPPHAFEHSVIEAAGELALVLGSSVAVAPPPRRQRRQHAARPDGRRWRSKDDCAAQRAASPPHDAEGGGPSTQRLSNHHTCSQTTTKSSPGKATAASRTRAAQGLSQHHPFSLSNHRATLTAKTLPKTRRQRGGSLYRVSTADGQQPKQHRPDPCARGTDGTGTWGVQPAPAHASAGAQGLSGVRHAAPAVSLFDLFPL
jgi:hypothetical protein